MRERRSWMGRVTRRSFMELSALGGAGFLIGCQEAARNEPPVKPTAQATARKETVHKVTSKDGTAIAFDRSGQGPALILVGGALSDRSGGAPLAALLAPRFTVFSYDRRGRGESGDTAPYAVEREVEDIEALVDEAGGAAFVYGKSSGAVLALEATKTFPARVKGLVLYEPPLIIDAGRPLPPKDYDKRVSELTAAGRRGDAVAFFLTEVVGMPAETVAEMRKAPAWPKLEGLAHTLAYDAAVTEGTMAGKPLPPRRWASATVPTLVMAGGASPAWMQRSAQALAGILPQAQHRTLEGQTHDVAPDVLAPAITKAFEPAR
jgi:pimeloyl-ACP methyl ester carboxylesterase